MNKNMLLAGLGTLVVVLLLYMMTKPKTETPLVAPASPSAQSATPSPESQPYIRVEQIPLAAGNQNNQTRDSQPVYDPPVHDTVLLN